MTELHITYDPTADTLYVRTKDDEVDDSIEVGEEIIVDHNAKWEVIGLEILNSSKGKVCLNDVVVKRIEVVIPQLQVYTRHALERIAQRRITFNEVEHCLLEPDVLLDENDLKRQNFGHNLQEPE